MHRRTGPPARHLGGSEAPARCQGSRSHRDERAPHDGSKGSGDRQGCTFPPLTPPRLRAGVKRANNCGRTGRGVRKSEVGRRRGEARGRGHHRRVGHGPTSPQKRQRESSGHCARRLPAGGIGCSTTGHETVLPPEPPVSHAGPASIHLPRGRKGDRRIMERAGGPGPKPGTHIARQDTTAIQNKQNKPNQRTI